MRYIYKYESFRLTERTIVYKVIRIDNNKFIAQFGLELAAKNFADYLNYNEINNVFLIFKTTEILEKIKL